MYIVNISDKMKVYGEIKSMHDVIKNTVTKTLSSCFEAKV